LDTERYRKIIPDFFDGRTRNAPILACFFRKITMVIDESHVTVPRGTAMYGGDHRETILVDYGFRYQPRLITGPKL